MSDWKGEAREALAQAEQRYRKMSYGDLLRLLDDQDEFEIKGSAGTRLCIEVHAVWDSSPQGNLRVFLSADNGGLRAMVLPPTVSFIVAPDGRFIGE